MADPFISEVMGTDTLRWYGAHREFKAQPRQTRRRLPQYKTPAKNLFFALLLNVLVGTTREPSAGSQRTLSAWGGGACAPIEWQVCSQATSFIFARKFEPSPGLLAG